DREPRPDGDPHRRLHHGRAGADPHGPGVPGHARRRARVHPRDRRRDGRLEQIRNDITGETPAAFEPALDYVVVKIPRFAFEKFPEADASLTTIMKSV